MSSPTATGPSTASPSAANPAVSDKRYHHNVSNATRHTTPLPATKARAAIEKQLAKADIRLNGERSWDIQVHHHGWVQRVLARGSLGLGESYMDGWWDCLALDQLFDRLLRTRLDEQVHTGLLLHSLCARLFNLQSRRRAWLVGEQHYDTGNGLFSAMLDRRMTYTCGYWATADNLDQAQTAKLDLVCRKLGLKPGMRLLDIGCGWGSLMKFAAENYGVSCVGLTISKEQIKLGQQRMGQLPVEFRLADYREYNQQGTERFDRIASLGMFEHVGRKNYSAYFNMARRCLRDDGLFLLHTIGKNLPGSGTDPWINRYIFPNGELPTVSWISEHLEGRFIIEDLHNFGADYDATLMAWQQRFEAAWPQLQAHYNDRFYRMWRYYLLSCAGAFRARTIQLWQYVLSPHGVTGGYQRLS